MCPELSQNIDTIVPLPILSVDLVAASYRSSTFPSDWSREKREREVRRYRQFLALAAARPGLRCTPTRDIDEIWHLHMLHPAAYHADSVRIFGRIFDHDGGFGTAPGELPILQSAFRNFAAEWQAAFGEAYVRTAEDPSTTNCWHDCSNRCWHACSSVEDAAAR